MNGSGKLSSIQTSERCDGFGPRIPSYDLGRREEVPHDMQADRRKGWRCSKVALCRCLFECFVEGETPGQDIGAKG